MKTKFILTTVAALALAACDKPKDPAADAAKAALDVASKENAKLKEQLDASRRQLADTRKQLDELNEQYIALGAKFDVNQGHLKKVTTAANNLVAATEAKERLDQIQDDLRERQAAASKPATDEQKLAAYVASGISGVPTNVATEIIRKAQQESTAWRSVYEIEQEGGGYLAVQDFATKVTQMPTSVRDEIVNDAKREHPNDWSQISDEVKQQAEAWKTLDEWKRVGMPGLNRTASAQAIAAAVQRYPKNWKMALYVVNDEAKKVTR